MDNTAGVDHILSGWKITYWSTLGLVHIQLNPGLTWLSGMLTVALIKCCLRQLNEFCSSLYQNNQSGWLNGSHMKIQVWPRTHRADCRAVGTGNPPQTVSISFCSNMPKMQDLHCFFYGPFLKVKFAVSTIWGMIGNILLWDKEQAYNKFPTQHQG